MKKTGWLLGYTKEGQPVMGTEHGYPCYSTTTKGLEKEARPMMATSKEVQTVYYLSDYQFKHVEYEAVPLVGKVVIVRSAKNGEGTAKGVK